MDNNALLLSTCALAGLHVGWAIKNKELEVASGCGPKPMRRIMKTIDRNVQCKVFIFLLLPAPSFIDVIISQAATMVGYYGLSSDHEGLGFVCQCLAHSKFLVLSLSLWKTTPGILKTLARFFVLRSSTIPVVFHFRGLWPVAIAGRQLSFLNLQQGLFPWVLTMPDLEARIISSDRKSIGVSSDSIYKFNPVSPWAIPSVGGSSTPDQPVMESDRRVSKDDGVWLGDGSMASLKVPPFPSFSPVVGTCNVCASNPTVGLFFPPRFIGNFRVFGAGGDLSDAK
ncbi:hypothetical protein GALMADRAFT_277161, partial [Galerina marginata CBS 339.88]